MATREIPFEGIYWWSDAKNVIPVLEEEIKKVFGHTRIDSIVIRGTDFNDGREDHEIEIKVTTRPNLITITEKGV